MDLTTHYYLDDYFFKYFTSEVKYPNPDVRANRAYTNVKWTYSMIYYLITSIWCYKILLGTSFMPTWLGGTGTPYNMEK